MPHSAAAWRSEPTSRPRVDHAVWSFRTGRPHSFDIRELMEVAMSKGFALAPATTGEAGRYTRTASLPEQMTSSKDDDHGNQPKKPAPRASRDRRVRADLEASARPRAILLAVWRMG